MHPPTLKVLLTLAWPIVVSRSTQVVVGLCDALMIAHLGDVGLAAVSTGGLNAFAAFIFPMGIAFIVSSYTAQLTGRGEMLAARRYGWYGLLLAAATQVVAMITLPGLPWMLGKMDYAPDVAVAMTSYLGIRLLSAGAAVGIEALGNYYGGMGNTAILMKTNLVAMVLNVLLNWLLIFGHWGFPEMGVTGAALASVIATAIAFAGFFVVFLWHGRGLPLPTLRLRELRRMLRVGVPLGLNWSFEFFAFIAFINVVVAGLGTSSLAAMMAVIQINSLAFMPAFGLASAGAILVGQRIGAKLPDQVPGLVRLTFSTTAGWMGAMGVMYLLVPKLILAPFVTDQMSAEFMQIGVRMLMLSAFWQIFDAAGITLTEALRAAGDTTFAMWSRAVLAWLVFLPGSWYCVRVLDGGDVVAMGWLMGYLALLAVALYWRFRTGVWRRLVLVEEDVVI